MKCDRCPRSEACAGESIRRLCDLVDPDHPDHNPAYLATLDPTPGTPPARDDPPPSDEPHVGCCGGMPY